MDIIIGAGVSGLSYANFIGGKSFKIVEKDAEVGGYCKTTKRNGFIWDYAGHFFHFQNPAIMHLMMDKLLSNDGVVNVQKKTIIKYKDRHIDYPFQKNIHQLPFQEFIDCLVDLFDIDKCSYSTFIDMLYCKFGKSISEKFLIPYNEKLYACDLNTLDKDAMGRFFPYADREQIIKGFRHTNNNSYNGSFLYPKEGAFEYIKQLSASIPTCSVETSNAVAKIFPVQHVVELQDGQRLQYEHLISTIPFPRLLDLANVKYESSKYNWNKVLVFNIGFDSKGPNTDTHWFYYPEKKYCFYRVGFYDVILNQSRTSIYVELGFKKDDSIDSSFWFPIVLKDLIDAGCITENQNVVDYETIIMDPGYVHITQESRADVKAKKELLSRMDIYSIGRYGSWTYCSIEDNIEEARALASMLNKK